MAKSFKEIICEMKIKLILIEEEWDRLDSMGTETETQNALATEMKTLSEIIDFWEDLLKRINENGK